MKTKVKTIQLAQLAAIVNYSSDAIISRDLNGKIVSWNKGAEKLYGYKASETIGKHISLIVPKELAHEVQTISKTIRQNENIENLETVRLRKDGQHINVWARVSPIQNTEGKVIGASIIARDITALKEQEKQREMFIGTVGHELRNTLTSIKIYAQILQKKIKKDQLEVLTYLQKIDNKINVLTKTINDTLDLTKIKNHKFEFFDEVVNFDRLIGNIIEEIRFITIHKIVIKGKTNKSITIDKNRINQLLTNLIINSAKYSPSNKEIIVMLSIYKNNLQVGVKDFGIGIPKKRQQKIFTPFYQVEDPFIHNSSGLGLGLYLSKEIVTHYGGKIWAESNKTKGSTFYFTIPLKE